MESEPAEKFKQDLGNYELPEASLIPATIEDPQLLSAEQGLKDSHGILSSFVR